MPNSLTGIVLHRPSATWDEALWSHCPLLKKGSDKVPSWTRSSVSPFGPGLWVLPCAVESSKNPPPQAPGQRARQPLLAVSPRARKVERLAALQSWSMRFFISSEQTVLHFQFAPGPANLGWSRLHGGR